MGAYVVAGRDGLDISRTAYISAGESVGNMSEEALRNFLHGSHGGFFLGAKATVEQPKKDEQKYPKRDPDAKDAVALLPLIYGLFKLNKKSILPIQRPLLGLQLPRTTVKGNWDLRVNKAMAIVIAHMKELKLSFYDTTVKNGGQVPFANTLLEINKIDTALVEALIAIKDHAIGGAVDVRYEILKVVKDQIVANKQIGIQLSTKLQNEWSKAFNDIQRLPLNYKVGYNPKDDFSGTSKQDAINFWTAGIISQGGDPAPPAVAETETGVPAPPAATENIFKAKAKAQETYQLDVIIASIKLHVLYYKKLAERMQQDGFIADLLNTIHKEQRHISDASKIVLGSDESADWNEKAGLFFRNVLIERFELLQANLYTFFTAYAGKGKDAEEYTQTVITIAVRAAVWPFFDSSEQRQIFATDTEQQKADKLKQIKERENGMFYKPHIDKLKLFFEHSQAVHALTDKDKAQIKTYATELFTALPISIKKVEMNNLAIPSRVKALDDNAGTKFQRMSAIKGEHAPKKVSVSLEFTEKNKAQLFRNALNTLMVAPELEYRVTSRIIHAAGLLDSAFVAAYYNTDDASKTTYATLVPQLLSLDPATGTLDKNGTGLLTRPNWLDAAKDAAADGDLLIIIKDAIPGLDTLFTFKNNCGSALTQPPKRAEKTKKAAQKKADGAKKKKGNGIKKPDNSSKKPDKKKADGKNKKPKEGTKKKGG